MATTIERRVDALETSHGMGGGGGKCPRCGEPWDDDDLADATWEVVFQNEPGSEDIGMFCGTCGECLDTGEYYVIGFSDGKFSSPA
jgi:hypothetical protein